MGLSALVISHRPIQKRKKGLKGITSKGKKLVRSCAAMMEDRYGRGRLSFITCTMPPIAPDGIATGQCVTQAESEKIALNWPELQRQFWQTVARRLAREGLPTDYVSVNEVQEQRFRRTGEVALHNHGLFVGRHPKQMWVIGPNEFRSMWERIISNCIERPISLPAATQIDSLRKSCKAEMGKYISKGCKITNAVIEAGKGYLLPTAWYNASKTLKAEVKAATKIYRDGFAEWIEENRWILRQEKMLSYTEVRIKMQYTTDFGETWKERERTVGIAGRFTSELALQKARSWFESGASLDLILTERKTG
jgi:hypothetical protein